MCARLMTRTPSWFCSSAIGSWIIAKKAEKNIAPGILRFTIVPVTVNGNPVNGLAMLIGPISITFMMLHVDDIVIGLRKTAGDRLDDAEGAVHPIRPKEGVV